jgi:hypothetical protein
MNAKRKATSPKENWQAIRRRYTWHLRPPFKSQFNHSHWWKGQSEIEPAAALYELARRHPLVRETWLKNFAAATRNRRGTARLWLPKLSWKEKVIQLPTGDVRLPHSLYWTCLFGLKSWAKLDYTERENWKFSAGYLKGLDLRDEELQCRSINKLAHWKIIDERKAALRRKGQTKDTTHIQSHDKWKSAYDENLSVLHNDLAVNPPTVEEWEAAIGYRAIEAYSQGYLLLAVAPGLQSDRGALLMQKVYGSAQRKYGRPKQRARWQDWLPLISAFEDVPTSPKSPVFVRYRRVLDGIHFA